MFPHPLLCFTKCIPNHSVAQDETLGAAFDSFLFFIPHIEPIRNPYWLCLQKLSPIHPFLFTLTTTIISYWSQFQDFPMTVPLAIYPQTLLVIFWEHKLRGFHFPSSDPILGTHYRREKTKNKQKKHLIMDYWLPGLCPLFWLYISTDYIIYFAWDIGLLSYVKLIATFDLVISSAPFCYSDLSLNITSL